MSYVQDWQRAIGVTADGQFGPATLKASMALLPAQPLTTSPAPAAELPWMKVARQHLGLHEGEDNAELRAFLASDHHALGDPSKLPWCGDFVETCIRIGVPAEEFSARLEANPYYARNWLDFGVACQPVYGCVIVFERGPSSGHVAFLVGQDEACWYCLGGNQSDSVCITPILKTRTLGTRWPRLHPAGSGVLQRMSRGSMVISRNEA